MAVSFGIKSWIEGGFIADPGDAVRHPARRPGEHRRRLLSGVCRREDHGIFAFAEFAYRYGLPRRSDLLGSLRGDRPW